MTTILFPLDEAAPAAVLTYRPWGTRTLKVRVTDVNGRFANRPLRIRPRLNDKAQAEAQTGIFRAYPDDSDAFVISWGGGHEPGPCLKAEDYLLAFERCVPLQTDDSSLIYFNLAHHGPDVPERATVTLEVFAYDEKRKQVQEVVATRTIALQRPAAYPNDAVHFVQADGAWQPAGAQVPAYDPRWWPRDVTYGALADYPLRVQVAGDALRVLWGETAVGIITDHTKPSIFQPETMMLELFDFDQWHLALRLWFFWQDVNIGGGHEVPDAERFDLLLRKKDGFVTLACTDMHWREVWAQIDGAPLRATLGLSNAAKLKLLAEGIEKIAHMFKREHGEDHEGVYSPVDGPRPLIPRQAERLGQGEFTTRGKGAEAHIPMLENVVKQSDDITKKMVSSDVRLG